MVRFIRLYISDSGEPIWINPSHIVEFYQKEIEPDEHDEKIDKFTSLKTIMGSWPVQETPNEILGRIKEAYE